MALVHTTNTPVRVPQFSDTPHNFVTLNADYLRAVPDEIDRLGCGRAVLLVSASLERATDRIRKLEAALGNRLVAKKVGVQAHTPYADVLDLARKLHASQADIVVSVGGSSYTDAAKIALLVHSSLQYPDFSASAMDTLLATHSDNGDITPSNALKAPLLKLIVVPTTLSAAEYHVGCGATHPETHMKVVFMHPRCAADSVLLDPALCTDTPQRLWLGTGMRAVDHCVEALCTELATRSVEASAEQGLRHLVPGLLACARDGADVAARGACQAGAWKAMETGHQWIPLGASHAIGHQMGAVACVPHGETSCVMLPAVMKYNKGVNRARQERVARIMWEAGGGAFEAHGLTRGTADAGDLIKDLVKTLGLPTTLGEVGVTEERQLDRIAEYTLADIWGKTNPRRIDNKEQVRDILRMAA
ncbi:Fe-containing alcohol dehydrogenase [Gautieria morchelliformis]|nr:Fe-containing alcohol dehydrogenase [Gautieria morchelliformis]